MFGRATIRLGIGPHSSFYLKYMHLYMSYVSVPVFVNFGRLSTKWKFLKSGGIFISTARKMFALRSCFQLKLLLLGTPIFRRATITLYFRATSSSLIIIIN